MLIKHGPDKVWIIIWVGGMQSNEYELIEIKR